MDCSDSKCSELIQTLVVMRLALQKGKSGCEILPPLEEYSWVNALALNKRPFRVARVLISFRKVMINLHTTELFWGHQSCTCYFLSLVSASKTVSAAWCPSYWLCVIFSCSLSFCYLPALL